MKTKMPDVIRFLRSAAWLSLALRKLVEEAALRGGLSLDLSLPEQPLPISPEIEQCIYHVAQEVISNVIHHAGARCLAVTLGCTGDTLRLTVRDDGLGFDAQGTAPTGHYSLQGIRERTRLIGGKIKIESARGGGTTVELIIGKEPYAYRAV